MSSQSKRIQVNEEHIQEFYQRAKAQNKMKFVIFLKKGIKKTMNRKKGHLKIYELEHIEEQGQSQGLVQMVYGNVNR